MQRARRPSVEILDVIVDDNSNKRAVRKTPQIATEKTLLNYLQSPVRRNQRTNTAFQVGQQSKRQLVELATAVHKHMANPRIKLPKIFLLPPRMPSLITPKIPEKYLDMANREKLVAATFKAFNANVFSNMLPETPLLLGGAGGHTLGMTTTKIEWPQGGNIRTEHKERYSVVHIEMFDDCFETMAKFLETMLHEMCHYWVAFTEIHFDRRTEWKGARTMNHHGDLWQATACHAMDVYPGIILLDKSYGYILGYPGPLDCGKLFKGGQIIRVTKESLKATIRGNK